MPLRLVPQLLDHHRAQIQRRVRRLPREAQHSRGERPCAPVRSAESHVDVLVHVAHEHVAEAGLLGVEEFEGHLDVEEIDHEHAEVALEPEQLVGGVEHDLDDGRVGEEVVELPAAVVCGDRVDRVVDNAGTDLSMRKKRTIQP